MDGAGDKLGAPMAACYSVLSGYRWRTKDMATIDLIKISKISIYTPRFLYTRQDFYIHTPFCAAPEDPLPEDPEDPLLF